MIWALLFVALFSVFGGDSPYLAPKMNKYVKRHVLDEGRKKELLEVLKTSKKTKKRYSKEKKQLAKEFKNVFLDRNTTKSEFELLIEKVDSSRLDIERVNLQVVTDLHHLINENEWHTIKGYIEKDFGKLSGKIAKNKSKRDKVFERLKSRIKKHVADDNNRQKNIKAVNTFHKILTVKTEYLTEMLLSQDSKLLKYNTPFEEIERIHNTIDDEIENLLNAYSILHFNLVENTTVEEWNKIKSSLRKIIM